MASLVRPEILKLKFTDTIEPRNSFEITLSRPFEPKDFYFPELPEAYRIAASYMLDEMFFAGYENHLKKIQMEKFAFYR